MATLVNLMEKIKNPGTFSVKGQMKSIIPGLTVHGVGQVAFPLIKSQAIALIAVSEQAPFGRGEDTIVDTSVRNVWQIAPDQFELTNPQWNGALQKIIDDHIKKELGLHDAKVQWEAYKLLIYEKGSFFKVHRDTEKIPNMFATLVVSLPSEHKGGDVLIGHTGQQEQYSFAEDDLFHPHYVAFYADCHHEVKPITSGYRICLIYNLAIANRKKQPSLSKQMQSMEKVTQYLQKWVKTDDSEKPLTYLLEHDYSERNLNPLNLKNGDFAKASVLLNAAEQNACQAFLCLVSYYRFSYGDIPYYGSRYRRYNNDLDESNFDEYGVESEEIYAHTFVTLQGESVDVQKFPLEESDILAKVPLLEGPGRGFSISEASGNEGATKDLWYHRGAIILWPKSRDFEMVAQMDAHYGIYFLKKYIKNHDLTEEEHLQKATQLASHLIDKQRTYKIHDLSDLLITIGNFVLVKKWIGRRMENLYDFDNFEEKNFRKFTDHFGWSAFEKDFLFYLTSKRGAIRWLRQLLLSDDPPSEEGVIVIKKWFEPLCQTAITKGPENGNWIPILQLLARLDLPNLAKSVLECFTQKRFPTFLTNTYGPNLVRAVKKLKGYEHNPTILETFAKDFFQRIQKEFPSPPVPSKNWSREGKLDCTCHFCVQVNEFLPNPDQSTLRFEKTLKREMSHVEDQIRRSHVDLNLEIIRMSPKFGGICTKTQKRYDQALELYNTAHELVEDLKKEID